MSQIPYLTFFVPSQVGIVHIVQTFRVTKEIADIKVDWHVHSVKIGQLAIAQPLKSANRQTIRLTRAVVGVTVKIEEMRSG